MSVRLMAAVWDLDLAPGEKLVLLALADQANDEGRQCWPSVATLASKSGQGERTVRRAIGDLEKKGHLTCHRRDGTSTQYHVHPCQNGTPAKTAPLPKTTKTPAKLAPKPPRTTNTPQATPSGGARKTCLPANFEPHLTANAQSVVAGWPTGMFDLELGKFKDRALAKGETYIDWQAAFRTWIANAERYRKDRNGSGNWNTNRGSASKPDGFRDALREIRSGQAH